MKNLINKVVSSNTDGWEINNDGIAKDIIELIKNIVDKAYLMGLVNGGSGDTPTHIVKELKRLRELGYPHPHSWIIPGVDKIKSND